MSKINNVDETAAMNARIAQKYDLMPYQSRAFAQTHPSHLAAIARICGLEATPPAKARILELGCASGGNIIPHATRYPDATFVGVDLGQVQVEQGRRRIEKLGLKNIELLCKSFTDIGDELGHFDYVIAHGVYSWVTKPVQHQLLRTVRARLSPTGMAFISYNVLPGWRMLQPVRDALLLQLPEGLKAADRVARARELLTFLKDETRHSGPYGEVLKAQAARLATLPDDYIEHEFLEDSNLPCSFREFVTDAAGCGLAYLGESGLASMVLENLGRETAAKVRKRTGNNLLESEQYVDLISGRLFRQSLLIATERLSKVDRQLSPERVASLHFVPLAGLQVVQERDAYIVSDPAGRSLTTDSKAVVRGVERLIARYPWSSTVDDCAEAISDKAREAGRQPLLEALYRMALVGMVGVADEAIAAPRAKGVLPEALPIARTDASDGAPTTTNPRHENVSLDAVARALLPLMDGTADTDALVERLTSEVAAGRLRIFEKGVALTEPKVLRKAAPELVQKLLSSLSQAGLLAAAPVSAAPEAA